MKVVVNPKLEENCFVGLNFLMFDQFQRSLVEIKDYALQKNWYNFRLLIPKVFERYISYLTLA